ncbi:MAG: beta galactosidase jelly roll domain-containing protein [Spirochaetales bacterium]|nr:beta galactosidase jelly roll domain-containing protein [Spirochaetales bacterium]
MTERRLRPASLFGSHMVLKRDCPISIFGTAKPHSRVSISFSGSIVYCTADNNGSWKSELPPFPAGGPASMEITAGQELIVFTDIMIGDVWFCSGQSNMGLIMDRLRFEYAGDFKNLRNENIRFFTVPETYAFTAEQNDIKGGKWQLLNNETITWLPATGIYFADNLEKESGIAVGIITASVGGTPIESWMSRQVLERFPQHLKEADRFRSVAYLDRFLRSEEKRCARWEKKSEQKDKGLKTHPRWSEPSADFSDARTVNIPGTWSEQTGYSSNGVFWFRRQISIPAQAEAKPARLWLGRIVDADTVWINGKKVGTTAYQYPPRIYEIEQGILKKGYNTITVRVISRNGRGEFCPGKPYYLETAQGRIDLEGPWSFKSGCRLPALPDAIRIVTKPCGTFNAMSAPVLQLPVSGMVWYQGESNVEDNTDYQEKLEAMLTDIRSRTGRTDFPVIIVQLPNFGPASGGDDCTHWAELREIQRRVAASENTGLVTTHDIGEWNDIHPLNKKDLGYRLACTALNMVYNKNAPLCPLPVSCKAEKNKLAVECINTGKGLITSNGEKAAGFALAGRDRKFINADARISGSTILISAETIAAPAYVRYAWADNPHDSNVVNSAGFPLPTFELQTE